MKMKMRQRLNLRHRNLVSSISIKLTRGVPYHIVHNNTRYMSIIFDMMRKKSIS